jgi:hypothetical protein
MNDFSETLLDLFGAGRCDRMLGVIALDGACMSNATGFAGLFFFAHAKKFTAMFSGVYLDGLLRSLTCEQWA